MQSKYIIPAVNEEFNKCIEAILNAARRKDEVRVASDGQHDSIGHSAKYCVVRFQDVDTGAALGFELVAKTDPGVESKSTRMEKIGTENGLRRLVEEEKLPITHIVTGRYCNAWCKPLVYNLYLSANSN